MLTINEAIAEYKKAQQENSKAQEAAKAAQEAARAAWNKVPREHIIHDKTSAEYTAAKAASQEESKANKKADYTAAVAAAAGQNVLYVTSNVLRAAILENPAKFSKPTHYKTFINSIQEITGPEFYLDNSLNCSLYICYRGVNYSNNSIFVCDKDHSTGLIKIDPERLTQKHRESTLKEIKAEAKKAIKDAEKIRAAAAKLEKLTKDTKNSYNTYINIYLPYFSAWDLHDDKRI